MWILLVCSLIAGVIALDQVTKLLVVHYLYEDSVALIPHVLHFTYVENRGMAFGLLADHRWVFLVFSVVGIALISFYLFRYATTTLSRVALALIVAGGVGNMIDRVARGFVVDFIDFCPFSFWVWVFNVADAAVTVGAILFALDLIFLLVREQKEKKCHNGVEKEEKEEDTHGDHA